MNNVSKTTVFETLFTIHALPFMLNFAGNCGGAVFIIYAAGRREIF